MTPVITQCHEFLNLLKILVHYFKFHLQYKERLLTVRNAMDINSSGSHICANQESYVSFLQRTERKEGIYQHIYKTISTTLSSRWLRTPGTNYCVTFRLEIQIISILWATSWIFKLWFTNYCNTTVKVNKLMTRFILLCFSLTSKILNLRNPDR